MHQNQVRKENKYTFRFKISQGDQLVEHSRKCKATKYRTHSSSAKYSLETMNTNKFKGKGGIFQENVLQS